MIISDSCRKDEKKEQGQSAGLFSPRLVAIAMTWLPIDETNDAGRSEPRKKTN
jgi:hypothetical protein